jgi:hypothetical protein
MVHDERRTASRKPRRSLVLRKESTGIQGLDELAGKGPRWVG